ncbi:MAG: hypothetical protein ABIJ59_17795 [Pseudomonadota bacterium]
MELITGVMGVIFLGAGVIFSGICIVDDVLGLLPLTGSLLLTFSGLFVLLFFHIKEPQQQKIIYFHEGREQSPAFVSAHFDVRLIK